MIASAGPASARCCDQPELENACSRQERGRCHAIFRRMVFIDFRRVDLYPNPGNQPHRIRGHGLPVGRAIRINSENRGATPGEGFSLRQVLRYLETSIYEAEIDGDRKLLDTIVTSDRIYRDGVEAERKVHALEAIIQRVLRLRISLTFRRVERDVVVARGAYHHTPLEGRAADEIEIYGKWGLSPGWWRGRRRLPASFRRCSLGGIGRTDRAAWSSARLKPHRKGQITWCYNERSPSTEQTRREDHDEASVLRHLQEQTGLTFTRERRPMRILFIEARGRLAGRRRRIPSGRFLRSRRQGVRRSRRRPSDQRGVPVFGCRDDTGLAIVVHVAGGEREPGWVQEYAVEGDEVRGRGRWCCRSHQSGDRRLEARQRMISALPSPDQVRSGHATLLAVSAGRTRRSCARSRWSAC